MKEKFYLEGHTLPTCVNIGCTRTVMVRDWKNWSIKSECGTCNKARLTGVMGKAMAGITIHKKQYCENVDGRLGWTCPVSMAVWMTGMWSGTLDLEHKDGDHYNNVPENVDTNCKMCHHKKSELAGDFHNTKSSARRIVN